MTTYTKIGANTEVMKKKDGDAEYLYLRIKISENGKQVSLGRSNSGKSERIATTGGNQSLGLVSDELFDVNIGLNVYKSIPEDER